MNMESLTAFWTVTQRRVGRITPALAESRINSLHAGAEHDSTHQKVLALWEMEKYGVWLGRHGKPREQDLRIRIAAMPIVLVGIGAGSIATLGFDADLVGPCADEEDPRLLWFWEGVGHMLALQYHPMAAFLLGMPRRKCPIPWNIWARQFGGPACERIRYGYERMQFLCGETLYAGTPGGQFGQAMIHHLDWEDRWFPGTAAAQAFIDLVWPLAQNSGASGKTQV